MRERRKITVRGNPLPVMRWSITNNYEPQKEPKIPFPLQPKNLKGKAALSKWLSDTCRQVEKQQMAAFNHWKETKEKAVSIRIEFMSWAWHCRVIGEHVQDIDGAWLDDGCCLCLPDGREIQGHIDELPDLRICANAAVLREERESGVSYEMLSGRIIETVKSEHSTTRKGMAKAAKYGYNLAMNERDKGAKPVGGQGKELPERIRKALNKVDTMINAKPKPGEKPTSARQACVEVHAEMNLGITAERLQNIHSSPKERERIGYKKPSTNPRASRK